MAKIYNVIGATGEYSDHNEWPVCAYLDEDKAKQHVELASAAAREMFNKSRKGGVTFWNYTDTHKNPYDPDMHMDYTGVEYYIWDVEIREELPITPAPKDENPDY